MASKSTQKLEKTCGVGEELDANILSYSLMITNRSRSIYFFKNILGMKIMRHMEYHEANHTRIDLNINGRWSSTIVAYGKQDDHFRLELIYNYAIKSYVPGNHFRGITIRCNKCLKRAMSVGWPVLPGNVLEAPGGYRFFIVDDSSSSTDPIVKITFAVSQLKESKSFYHDAVGFRSFESGAATTAVGFRQNETKVELKKVDEPITKGENTGVLGVGIEYDEEVSLEERLNSAERKVTIALTAMDTPGQPTMAIMCVEDPDGLQIMFYELSPYRAISRFSPDDENFLIKKMEEDEVVLDYPISKKSNKRASFVEDNIRDAFRTVDKSEENVSTESSQKSSKSKLKRGSKSFGSLKNLLKKKPKEEMRDESTETEDATVNEATTSWQQASTSRRGLGKGLAKSLGSLKNLPQYLKSRSEVWKHGNKNKRDKGT